VILDLPSGILQDLVNLLSSLLLGFHMLPLSLKEVLRSSTTLLIGEAGKLLYNYARLLWKKREN
jgi:hypothetical protein